MQLRRSGLFAAIAILPFAVIAPAKAEVLFALTTTDVLYAFDSASPTTPTLVGLLDLPGVETVLSIDFRATDGTLYALGSLGNIYTVAGTTPTLLSTAPVGNISGADYEIDFNPVPNALRIIRANDGQNLRIGGGAGLGAFNQDTPYPDGITPVGTAYTNNDTNPATGTTLFVLDDDTDSLIQVTNANNPPGGSLIDRGTLGVAISGITPFDISGRSGVGYAIVGGSLYSLNVTSAGEVDNRASLIGTVGDGSLTFKGLSVSTAAPEPGTLALLGLGLIGGIVARRKK